MYVTSDAVSLPLTVGELRKKIKNLPDDTIVICEDGNYTCATVEDAKVCTHFALDREDNTEIFPDTSEHTTAQALAKYQERYPHRQLFELKHRVLCIETAGQFKVPEDSSKK